MAKLRDRILEAVRSTPGLTDRELADRLLGQGAPQQNVNQAARQLASTGQLVRHKRLGGRLRNYPGDAAQDTLPGALSPAQRPPDNSSPEDDAKRAIKTGPEALRRLEDIGFRKVGSWSLVSGEPACSLASDASARNVLYAFVSGRDVLYVGKTTQALSRRMYGYQRPGPTQHTNIAGRIHISKVLASQRPLDIYALCDNVTRTHGTFAVNLAAGLEDAIVRDLQPPWNKMGK